MRSFFVVGCMAAACACMTLVGCQRPDDALVRQMEEMRKELASLKKDTPPKAEQPMQLPYAMPNQNAPAQENHYPTSARYSETLPVVKVAPRIAQPNRWSGKAPVARALMPKKEAIGSSKRKKNDIPLPKTDVPPLVFQTLDEYGQIHGDQAVPTHSAMAAPAPKMEEEDYRRSADIQVDALAHPIDPPPGYVKDTRNFPGMITAEPSSAPASAPTVAVPETITPESHPMTLVSSSSASSAPISTSQRLYDTGMAALRRKNYASAIQAFQGLLNDNPEDGLADNALYWMGEARYDQGRYQQALSLFQDVLREYPLGNKVPDAMVKVGLCFQNLGKTRQAREVLEQVIAIYPTSQAARVAESRLPTM